MGALRARQDRLWTLLCAHGSEGREKLSETATLWNPLKQRKAVQLLVYYALQLEKNSFLSSPSHRLFGQSRGSCKKASPTDAAAIDEPVPG